MRNQRNHTDFMGDMCVCVCVLTSRDIASFAQISLMCAEDLPSIVINILNIRVGNLKKGNFVAIPCCIISKVLFAECRSVECCQGSASGKAGD